MLNMFNKKDQEISIAGILLSLLVLSKVGILGPAYHPITQRSRGKKIPNILIWHTFPI